MKKLTQSQGWKKMGKIQSALAAARAAKDAEVVRELEAELDRLSE